MIDKLEVILLAAGRGSRLIPITDHIPKCLVPICGIPLLQIWLDKLVELPYIGKVHINTSYMANKVDKFISEYNSEKIKVHFEEELLGTAGTINKLMDQIITETVMIVHADNLSVFDVDKFYEAYRMRETDQIGTMMTFETDNPRSCGIVTLENNNKIIDYVEKPHMAKSSLANAAIYIINRKQYLSTINFNDYDFSKDYIAREYKRLNVYLNDKLHLDIGSIESYLNSQIYYKKLQ